MGGNVSKDINHLVRPNSIMILDHESKSVEKTLHPDIKAAESLLMDDLNKLRSKIKQLEQVIEDKDLQIQAILETLDEKEKEIDDLHETPIVQAPVVV